MANPKQLLLRNEFLVLFTIIILSIIISLENENFLTLANLFRLTRGATVMGIFSLGAFIVLVSGGIDVSFPAIAIFSLYSTVRILDGIGFEPWLQQTLANGGEITHNVEVTSYYITAFVALLLGGMIGTILGFINACQGTAESALVLDHIRF